MKTLKMLVLVVAITFSSAMSASTNSSIENAEPETLTGTISQLLKNPKVQFNKDMTAMVEVTINQDNELVVLSVDTQNKVFESFIKNRLNYKKVSKEAIGKQKHFKIPVTITK